MVKTAGRSRSGIERERDRVIVAEQYLQGKTQASIALILGVSQQQVCYDLKIVQRRWRQDSDRDFDTAVSQELAKIDNLERTYWASWERSLEVQVKVARERTGHDRATDRIRVQREQLIGNPTFLAGVQWCIDRRCKLLGLDAPERVDITARIRERAITEGLDPDQAVAAAQRILRERAAR